MTNVTVSGEETAALLESIVPAQGGVVVHISESFGGGVAAAIKDYVRNSPSFSHELICATRADAPLGTDSLEGFTQVRQMPDGHLRRISYLRKVAARSDVALIHAHSSFGGFYARLAFKKTKIRPIIYTPHCYGFQRRDIGILKRTLIWITEAALSMNTSVTAGCSHNEVRASRWFSSVKRMVPNVTPPASDDLDYARKPTSPGAALRIAGAGRLTAQKDPTFFVAAKMQCESLKVSTDFVWIGGGTEDDEMFMRDHGIRVTGWLSRKAAGIEMSEADIYLHSASWEGFPIAVLEAVACGTPTITRSIKAFEGVALGCSIEEPSQVPRALLSLVDDEARLDLLARQRLALGSNSNSRQAAVLAQIYKGDPDGR